MVKPNISIQPLTVTIPLCKHIQLLPDACQGFQSRPLEGLVSLPSACFSRGSGTCGTCDSTALQVIQPTRGMAGQPKQATPICHSFLSLHCQLDENQLDTAHLEELSGCRVLKFEQPAGADGITALAKTLR